MRYGRNIVNGLLDSYENSGNFDGNTGRRVFLKKSFKRPDTDSTDYEEFLSELIKLQSRGIADFDWRIKGHVADKIWLLTENVQSAYDFVCRENKHSSLARVELAVRNTENRIDSGWIKEYLNRVLDDISKNKLSGFWKEEPRLVNDVLKALELIYSLNGASISMRAASVKLYSDSKRFENEIKRHIVSIAKKFEPVLAEADEEDISEREILSQLGIIKMSEIIEFCGGLKVFYMNGEIDYSPIKNGACVSGDCLSEIERVELSDVQSILFIENKTNYTEYCLNSRRNNELVVFHGGLYSPAKGYFFRLISKALSDEQVFYWGDIDMGGFNMFCRLKENIFPSLLPYNMDRKSFEQYKSKGLLRSKTYLDKIAKLKNTERYAAFFDVIELIIESGVTVEQEAFIK